MEHLINHELLSVWLMQYGSIVLFTLLVLGIVAFPIPEETMMIVAGILMSKATLSIPLTLIATYAGSICGITISYILGRTAGSYLVYKYGGWIGVSHHHLNKMEGWFEKYGKWTLLIGYFIPGIRHFTGFSSGMTNMKYKQFALYAYFGAVIWVTTFLSIGYFFGDYGFSYLENIDFNLDNIITVLGFLIIGFLFYKLTLKSDPKATQK